MDSLTDSDAGSDSVADDGGWAGRSSQVVDLLAGAVEQARAAVIEFSGETVGDYLGVSFDDDVAATHRFLAALPGYHGWQWAVVVAAYPGADHATISEVVLVPGPTALLAPPWLPWEERVRPGDLGPGDLLAPLPDDPRLAPGFAATGDPLVDDTVVELGLGRRRVLSAVGRDETAQRWHDGDFGPASPMARSTKRMCRDCGFMVPLAGALGAMFGVCCNEMAADGHVVDLCYGCGAHSDTPAPAGAGSPAHDPFDDGVVEVMPRPEVSESVSEIIGESAPESGVEPPDSDEVSTETVTTDEPLGAVAVSEASDPEACADD